MARDGLLLFTGTLSGATVGTGGLTSNALTISPILAGHRREIVARVNVNQTATTGSPTAIRWTVSLQVSKDGSTWTTTASSPSDTAAMSSTVTSNVPGDTSIMYYLPVTVPQSYVDASGVVQDNYNQVRIVAAPTFTAGTSPNVNCAVTAAIVSGKDGAYS